jgi:hypothetical protein
MRPAKSRTQTPVAFPEGDLLQLELRIAKRADKLRKRGGCQSVSDLILWLQAESEVLEGYYGWKQPLAVLAAGSGLDGSKAWAVT